jgi:hypothetical protein
MNALAKLIDTKPKPRFYALVIEAKPEAQLGNVLQGSTQLWEHMTEREMAIEAAALRLRSALIQVAPSDDKIIVEHIQAALNLLCGADVIVEPGCVVYAHLMPKSCRIIRSIEITAEMANRAW